MTDEPRQPVAQTSISDSTITGSTIHQETHIGDRHYHAPATWQPRWEPPQAEAQDLLDLMPTDRVPEISALPSGSRMPFAPNPHFVGRDAVLLSLATALQGGARVAIGPKAAATGLGGIGKTSVAVEVAHRLGSYFAGGVFWLLFADAAAIPSEIVACGGPGLLDLHPSYGELKQDEQLALVRQAWQRPIPRLLIFDNCEQPELVRAWAPTSGGCRVLITSRRQTWPSSLGISALSLDVLARVASVALLRDLASRLTPEEADALAEEMADFPLALQLAGSYLAQFGRISVATYLAELRSDVILAHPSLRGVHDDVLTTAHDRHVGRTFLLSYQKLDPARDALALALLARAGCLAPGAPIPLELLASADLAAEDAAGQIALARLVDLGFMTLGDEGVVLHRLVHAFVDAVMREEGGLAAVEEALNDKAFAINEAGYPAAMQPIVVHLWWITRQKHSQWHTTMGSLCNNLGAHLEITGDYGAAQPLYERALVIREQMLGASHPHTATSLNNLAGLLKSMGHYGAARPLFERALVATETTFGASDPKTAAILNNLAGLLKSMGDYGTALALNKRALGICEEILGTSHPDTATGLTNLAEVLRVMGNYKEARPLFERALAICEQAFGTTHPRTASVLNSLALLLISTKDYRTARSMLQQALMIREQVLGASHPDTATSLNNLAGLLKSTGDYGAARPLFERALAICVQTLGPTHPQTATNLNNLAGLHYATGHYGAARPLYEQALAICNQAVGTTHPTTQAIRTNLETLLLMMKGDQ